MTKRYESRLYDRVSETVQVLIARRIVMTMVLRARQYMLESTVVKGGEGQPREFEEERVKCVTGCLVSIISNLAQCLAYRTGIRVTIIYLSNAKFGSEIRFEIIYNCMYL